ncbi:MAG: hypothetical protein H6600_07680 [Flavobacteriales bacterium]|nr:hypothetical protein [Flavobacteriales bacterium]MCB9198323.1 hypothetical protein [Flavobacteriales bacterium]
MKKLASILLLTILIHSCGLGDPQDISLKLEDGETYSYYIVADMDIVQEINGMTMNQKVEASSKVNYTVYKETEEGYTFEVKYEKIKMYMDMGMGNPIEFDSEHPDPNNTTAMTLNKMKDQTFFLTVSKHGEIISFEGLEEMTDNIISSLEIKDYNIELQVRNFMTQTYSESTLMVAFEPMFNIYPIERVSVGDTWKKENKGENHIGKLEEFEYTLKSVESSNYKIEGFGNITEIKNPETIAIAGNEITYHLNGEINSSFEVDAKTGWVINGEVVQQAEGINDLNITMINQFMKVPMNYQATIRFSKNGFKD